MKQLHRTATAMLLLLVMTLGASAAGFRINEQGAKAMGMANAFAAQADDPSALFYNPAGIAFQPGNRVSVGTTVINVPETKFTGTTPLSANTVGPTTIISERARRDIFFPPNIYATSTMKDAPFSFGIGVNSQYPLAKRWDTTSFFRDTIQEIAIKPINVQPTVAWRSDALKLSVAAGLDYTHATVWLQKMAYAPPVPVSATELGVVELEGTGDGFGYNAGLAWHPTDKLKVGIAYRSKIHLAVDGGDVDFLATTATGQGAVGLTPGGAVKTVSSTVSTDITLPDTWSFAVAYNPVERLTLEVDVDKVGWSSYDKLAFDFDGALNGFDKTDPKNWQDAWAYRFGAQFAVTPAVDLRAGYAYDNTPIRDRTLGPELPDADRENYTAGIGFHNDRGALDLAYMWVKFKDRTVNNPNIQTGTYENDAHLVAINVSTYF
ncbi:MAG TPA: TonB-dependent receptor [Geobacterales bacterium]|nr:TonB-dependent receptor [Geobacterales bacterium]